MKMNLTRNFIDQTFSLNKKIILEKSSTHHLLKVLRKKCLHLIEVPHTKINIHF